MTSRDAALAQVVASTDSMLLDFDGPVSPLFADGRAHQVLELVRSRLVDEGVELPPDLRVTSDPLDFYRARNRIVAPQTVVNALDEAEVWAAGAAPITDGAEHLLVNCLRANLPVVIVSNNSGRAVKHFLRVHRLSVRAVVARGKSGRLPLKPAPQMLLAGAMFTPGLRSTFIFGDSVSDIEAAHAAGIASVGFGKNPRRAVELADAKATVVVNDVCTLADAIRNNPKGMH